MNLFVLGYNTSPGLMPSAENELRGMRGIYPVWDAQVCRTVASPDGRCFSVSLHDSPANIQPRRYIWQSDGETVFYDGIPVDERGEFFAQDAKELAAHWDELPERLTGHFVAVRVRPNPPSLEVVTDLLGIQQVYYARHGEGWMIANSMRPLVRLCHRTSFDPVGVSMFLSQGWVWKDRTLREGVRVVRGGEHWRFGRGNSQPTVVKYAGPATLAPRRKQRLRREQLETLADRLARPCEFLGQHVGQLRCPLTGGRDSRLVAALLARRDAPVTFNTSGEPDSEDVQIAAQVARAMHRPHEVRPNRADNVVEQWERYCRRTVEQGDGMISLWLIRGIQEQPQTVSARQLSLSGMGGEVARGYYYRPSEMFGRGRPADLVAIMTDRLMYHSDGLLRPVVDETGAAELRSYAHGALEAGLRSLDVLDAFYAWERVGRWGGTNRRRTMSYADVFAPLCTRAFVETSLSLPYSLRCGQWLHRRLLAEASPTLARMPFDHGRWPPRWPALHLAQWASQRLLRRARRRFGRSRPTRQARRAPLHAQWLEAKLDWIRSICFDQSSSPLWNFVDRPKLESILDPAGSAARRRVYGVKIYEIMTLFYYAAQPVGQGDEPLTQRQ
ncbi:MAG: asparagine synthase-related protein [Planctomycetota bacterium]